MRWLYHYLFVFIMPPLQHRQISRVIYSIYAKIGYISNQRDTSLWLPETFICLSVCLPVLLSRIYGSFLDYYGSNFDETWWKCWDLCTIDCNEIFNKNRFSDDITMTSFLILLSAFLQGDIILRQRKMTIILCPDCDTIESRQSCCLIDDFYDLI